MSNRVCKCYILPFTISNNFSCVHGVTIYNKFYPNFSCGSYACPLYMPVWLLHDGALRDPGTRFILLFRKISNDAGSDLNYFLLFQINPAIPGSRFQSIYREIDDM